MAITFTRRAALAAAGAAGLLGLGAAAKAQAQTVLRIGHVLGPTHQFHTGLELAAKQLAEATEGRVELQVFPAAQLGSERDMNVAIRTGGIEMTLASPGGASVHLKQLAILDAPYLFRDNAHWQSVVSGGIGQRWQDEILAASGLRIIGWFHRGTRHVISRTQAFETLPSIKGAKIRVADLPPYPQVFQAFGSVPTPIPFSEMYQALESGVVDGADAPLDTVLAQKLHEVAKYVNLIGWSFAAPGPILISDQAWSQLSAADQEALVAAIAAASDYVTAAFTDGEAEVREKLVAEGMTLVEPTDPEAWAAAAASAIPGLAATWGGDVALYDQIRAAD